MGGADKALMPLAGRPLIAHVLDRFSPQVDGVVISANGDPARFRAYGCQVLADAVPQGPLSGILAALVRAGALGATHVASVPVDTPFLPDDLVARLVLAAEGAAEDVSFAQAGGRDHPATALWPVALAPRVAAFLAEGGAKLRQFARDHGARPADFPDPRAFQNLNTPEDLAQAEAFLRGAA